MEINRSGLQALYGSVPASSPAGAAAGVSAPAGRGPAGVDAGNAASQPPSSTKVSLSAAGQSMLATEQQNPELARAAAQQSASAPQNVPVQNAAQTRPVRNEAPGFTTAAPAGMATQSLPLQQASVTQPTGAATPRPQPERMAAAPTAVTPADPMARPAVAADPMARVSVGAPMPDSQAEGAAQASRVRQDVQAQARQDVSPVLAQGGVAAYQGVLSL